MLCVNNDEKYPTSEPLHVFFVNDAKAVNKNL